MKFKFLLCIDDTDELGGDISTGLIAEEIAAFAGSFAPVSFVTRHQLLFAKARPARNPVSQRPLKKIS